MSIEPTGLPEVLAVAYQAGGWDAVRGLVAVLGGKRIAIPKWKTGDNHPLVVAGGRKAADAIVARFGGERGFQFPRANGTMAALVVEAMPLASTNELAAALKLTYRQAHRIKRAMHGGKAVRAAKARAERRRDPRQIDLEDLLSTK